MTRLFCAALMVCIATISSYSHSQNIPSKRIIIQLSHESTPEYTQKLCTDITLIIGECTLVSRQDTRWLVKLPSGLSQEKIDVITQKINSLDGVSFAEEDRLMKPLTKPPKLLIQ